MAKICLKCGNTLDDNAKFCPKCGSEYGTTPVCVKCGHELTSNSRFCPKCGADQTVSAPKASPTGAGESHIKKGFDTAAAIIHMVGRKSGKGGVKNSAKFGRLVLILAVLVGTVAAFASRSSAQKELKWAKSHLDDGTMYIYTVDDLQGTITDASGKQSKVYMRLYQDKDSFFVTLKDSGKHDLSNTSSDPLTINVTIDVPGGNEGLKNFTATESGNSNIIRFSSMPNGFIRTMIEDEELQGHALIFNFPDGSVGHMNMPGKNNYHEIWELTSSFWYVPTFNDDIYTGKDVHPDLVSYLEDFESALYDEIEKREKMGAKVSLVYDLLRINSNPKSNIMWKKFNEMKYLARTVDAEYYAECRWRVESALTKFSLSQAGEYAQIIANILSWLDSV